MLRRGFSYADEYPVSSGHVGGGAVAGNSHVHAQRTDRARHVLRTPPVPHDLAQQRGFTGSSAFASHRVVGVAASAAPTSPPAIPAEDLRPLLVRLAHELLAKIDSSVPPSVAVKIISAAIASFQETDDVASTPLRFPLSSAHHSELARHIIQQLERYREHLRAAAALEAATAEAASATLPRLGDLSRRTTSLDLRREATKSQMIQLLLRSAPERVPEVDRLLDEAIATQLGDPSYALALLRREYPEIAMAQSAIAATAAVSQPMHSPEGITIYATVRAPPSASARWTFAAGNKFHLQPISLENYQRLGIAETLCVDDDGTTCTVGLQLRRAAVPEGKQFTATIHVCDLGEIVCSDSVTFIA